MTGWLADSFRFWWALFYWNTRKTWFRLQGAHRDDCPCQVSSDSGHARDSRCEASVNWRQPARFRRVCPLLTETPQGWRCGVNAESARPFWGRAAGYAAALAVVLYLGGTLAVFAFLKLAHYDASYLAVAWPPRWRELRRSQETLYAGRAQRALQTGNYQEAILALDMVTRLNPRNYQAGLALAGLCQSAAQPFLADRVYERLMRDVPEQRRPTAQIWFRALLARGAYGKIQELALVMLTEDPAERAAWLNALLFSSRHNHDPVFLGKVAAEQPHLPDWCTELIGLERLLLQNQLEAALPRLTRVHRSPATAYIPYYQVDRLLRHGRADQANHLLQAYQGPLPPDEAAFLRLRIYRAKEWASLADSEFDGLLNYQLAPRLIAQFCAYLISNPDRALFARYYERLAAAGFPVNADTLHLHQATYLAAVLAGEAGSAEKIAARINQFTASEARALHGLGTLLKNRADNPRLGRILPLVPLPTEAVYAILDRQPAAAVPGK
ncbi:MAG: hypothetical protein HYX71_02400 [Opitutae bacterium]|nr:hypothetical protein [Opitutae bacterium]